MRPRVADVLESRRLLTAPQIPGNIGQILSSQFQPFGFKTTVGTQLRDVRVRGPFKIDLSGPAQPTGPVATSPAPPINSGLIGFSQFNGGGFHTVGLQFDRVTLGRGLTVGGFDNEQVGPAGTAQTFAPAASDASAETTPPAYINRSLIFRSQFNDGGFGTIEINPDGTIVEREGRVGLQWHETRVRGPVDIGLDDVIIQPGARASTPSASTAVSDPGETVEDLTTNIGRIRGSQFNDGGFGDIGMQWSDVTVGGRVGTSTNTLFIKPQQDNFGPITVQDRVFGQRAADVTSPPVDGQSTDGPAELRARPGARAALRDPLFRVTYSNEATNSGRIVGAQFSDGGFGDIGLQWKQVRVGGDVTAVHNSLTVQPENKGQGQITVQGIRFPTSPPPPPRPEPGPFRVLPPDPPIVESDGDPVATKLPIPSGPLSPLFPIPFGGPGTLTRPHPGNFPLVNAATNSGLIVGGQFSAGGFGDQGLQWQKVGVRGDVRLVHNSLSVHPEGSGLAGISVNDVAYGPPISPGVARHLAVLPTFVISPGDLPAEGETSVRVGGRVLNPPNDRWLTNQQLAAASGTDIFLQWNGIDYRNGLVIVHNIIKISGVGPTTGPITISNIRFPFRVPPVAPLTITTSRAAASAIDPSDEPILLNTANNSGILSHAQFSDGGFGDVGLQWRNVSVDGSVVVAHNTLAVDASSDLPPGDVAGPITISNVTFNSGALEGVRSRPRDRILVSPPDIFQRASSRPVDPGQPLPRDRAVRDESTNSGFMAGGQLAAGGANHALLQWQCVKVAGKVRIIDNVLSISVADRPSGPITISDVTFA
jgi:hypothetical protein